MASSSYLVMLKNGHQSEVYIGIDPYAAPPILVTPPPVKLVRRASAAATDI